MASIPIFDNWHLGQASLQRGMLTDKTSFLFETTAGAGVTIKGQNKFVAPQLFKDKGLNFEKLGIGGLDTQFVEIFRRAFQSRLVPQSLAERLGVPHVKGMLLHGPPGTGNCTEKTRESNTPWDIY